MASSRFCPACGRPVDASAAFCGACGAAMPAPGAPPAYASAYTPTPATVAPYSSARGPLTDAQLAEVDGRAMDMVLLASILGLVGTVAAFVLPYAFGYSLFSTASTNPRSFPSLNVLYALIGTTSVGVAFTCVQLWFFRQAFQPLAQKDPGLRTPATLALLAIVGVVLLLVGVILLLAVVYQMFQCAGNVTPIPTNCVNVGQLGAGAGVLVVGGIIALVGYIGVWLGLWRLGTRYNESMFKVGMVLLIIPLLDIVGFIVLLVASRSVRARVSARIPAAPMGSR